MSFLLQLNAIFRPPGTVVPGVWRPPDLGLHLIERNRCSKSTVYNPRVSAAIQPARLLGKALLVFLAFEFTLASVPLHLGAIDSFAALDLQRERFPISTLPSVDAALDVGNLDAMFAAHVVTRPRHPTNFACWYLEIPLHGDFDLPCPKRFPAN